MANTTTLLFLLLAFFISGGILRMASASQGQWCVAKPTASDQELQNNINYACSYVNCNLILPGGVCFYPQTLINYASAVMNLYYQKSGRNFWNCDFNKSAIIAITDPSSGQCKYEFD